MPVVAQQLLGLERPRHSHTRSEQLHAGSIGRQALGASLRVEVEALEQALAVQALRLDGLHVRLVVDGDVVDDVAVVVGERLVRAVHPVQAVLHDVRDLVGERRVVVHHTGIRRSQQR